MIDDYIQDGLDDLDKSKAPYVVMVGFGNKTIMHSNLGAQNVELLRKWVDDGRLLKIFKTHLQKLKTNE
jgi:hypothetical protein